MIQKYIFWHQDEEKYRNGHFKYLGGHERWFQNGKLHRNNGPAVIESDGTQSWYINGQRHRIGGPAIVAANGDQLWYHNDRLHREGGPAVIHAVGTQSWWENGCHIRTIQPLQLDESFDWKVEGF